MNGGGSAGIVIDDELAVLKSHTLWYEVVSKLGLNAEYVEPLTWKYKQYVNTPFLMVADSSTLKSQEETIEFYVREDREGKIKIEGKKVRSGLMSFLHYLRSLNSVIIGLS